MQIVLSTSTGHMDWLKPESIGHWMFFSVLPSEPKDFKNSSQTWRRQSVGEYKPHSGRRRKHWIETYFKVNFQSILFYNTEILSIDYNFYLIYHCITFRSNVLYQCLSYLECLSSINILCSLRKEVDLKSTLKSEFYSFVFNDVRNKLISAHCTVTSNVLTVTDKNFECIFQSCQLFCSYHLVVYLIQDVSLFMFLEAGDRCGKKCRHQRT